jgi:hypothetical protein
MSRPRRDQLLLPILVGVLIVVAGVIGLAIWRSRGDDQVTLPDAVAASPSTDPDRIAVLAAYDGYVRASVEANRRGEPRYAGLELYAGELLRAQIANGISQHIAAGNYYQGELKSEATVASIDLQSNPPVATISACMDATNYRLVNRTDNSPVPGASAGRRYMATASAAMNTNGRWLITGTAAHTDQSC